MSTAKIPNKFFFMCLYLLCKSVNVQISEFTPYLHYVTFVLVQYYICRKGLCPHTKGWEFRIFAYQRLAENMGLVEKSSVTAFLDGYYEKHPLDNSYEGILARRSGLTKEQVIAYLDKLEYLAKIAEYDPTGKAPILKGDAREDHQFRIESKNNEEYLLGVNIFYIEERRIRNFAS